MSFSLEQSVAPYLVYSVENRYVANFGNAIVPAGYQTTGRPADTKAVQVHAPHGFRILSFQLVRVRRQPTVPKMEDFDKNVETLHSYEVVPSTPSQSVGGSQIYAVSGQYVYLLLKPPTDTSAVFKTPRSPIDLNEPDQLLLRLFKAIF